MPIAALPADTVRLIGSSQSLTDSVSVIKELFDNALDARATSVSVSISANTLDVIQVRDNGRGISPEDRDLVGRRYCTSKISNWSDLENVGGSSLGFRGEALASMAEMSKCLHLITRIEGEVVGTRLSIMRDGVVSKQGNTSHPVGTTVTVTDFLKSVPVRKQQALKSTAKTLTRIKKLLEGYAFARPSVRFSVTVLKSKNEKGNWTYAPSGSATSADAALSILGRETFTQCELLTMTGKDNSNEGRYALVAFLPKADADFSKIGNKGHFISIDSRPVSCIRGKLKQALDLYRKHIRFASGLDKLSEPFICMNIKCPIGSYDPNIEPSKDDVLFSEPETVFELIEGLFRDIYGDPDVNRDVSAVTEKPAIGKTKGFDLLLSRTPQMTQDIMNSHSTLTNPSKLSGKPTLSLTTDNMEPGNAEEIDSETTSTSAEISMDHKEVASENGENKPLGGGRCGTWQHNMYESEEDDDIVQGVLADPSHPSHVGSTEPDLESISRDISVSNPWTLAKMHAPIRPVTVSRPPIDAQISQHPSPKHPSERLPRMQESPSESETYLTGQNSLPSTLTSQIDSSPRGPSSRPIDDRKEIDRQLARIRYGQGAIDTWVQKAMDHHNSPERSQNVAVNRLVRPQSDLPLTEDERPSGAMNDIRWPLKRKEAAVRKKGAQAQAILKKTFTPPARDPYDVWFNFGESSNRQPSKLVKECQPHLVASDIGLLPPAEQIQPTNAPSSTDAMPFPPTLHELMEFEHRKAAVVNERREKILRQAELVSHHDQAKALDGRNTNSPHRNRSNAAIAALSQFTHSMDPGSKSFSDGDPRAYLMEIQKQQGCIEISKPQEGHKFHRTKTSKLPLESVPPNLHVQNMLQQMEIDVSTIQQMMKELSHFDLYVQQGAIESGLPTEGSGKTALDLELLSTTQTLWNNKHGASLDLHADLYGDD